MPFKIVKTIQKGKFIYTTVPYQWESMGILSWPRENADRLRRLENSQPGANWLSINCMAVKSNLLSFQRAEVELRKIRANLEMADDTEPLSRQRSTFKSFENFDTDCDVIELDSPPTVSVIKEEIPDEKEAIIEEITETPENNEYFASEMRLDNTLLMNLILTKVDAIMENQKILQDSMVNNFKKLQDQQRLLNRGLQAVTMNLAKYTRRMGMVSKPTGLNERQTSFPHRITSLQDLEEFENLLKCPEKEAEMFERYSIICGIGKGHGLDNAYTLCDVIFDRAFLSNCSWAGGSRTEETKVCFKSYTRTLKFFFDVVFASDNTFTMNDCSSFFKIVLKNSKKRSESKHMRASTSRKRRKFRRDSSIDNLLPPGEIIQGSEVSLPSVEPETPKELSLAEDQESLKVIMPEDLEMDQPLNRLREPTIGMEVTTKTTSHLKDKATISEPSRLLNRSRNVSFKPISSQNELEDLETMLRHPESEAELFERYITVCGVDKGKGMNNAYTLIDAIFDRTFLTNCTWAGGSRSEETKICFRSFTRVIKFFFDLVFASDNTFTMNDCYNFLKNVLRNSKKRSESKRLRASTSKNRPKMNDYINSRSLHQSILDTIQTVDVSMPSADSHPVEPSDNSEEDESDYLL